jgi:hypothetical protein
MAQLLQDLATGMALMRRAATLYVLLIGMAAFGSVIAAGTPVAILFLVVLIFVHYWLLMLPVGLLMAPENYQGLFWRFRAAPFWGNLIYPFFAAFRTFLLMLPVMLVSFFLFGMVFQDVDFSGVEAGERPELTTDHLIFFGITIFIPLVLLISHFMSSRITVPVLCAMWGTDMAKSDQAGGPQSGRKWPRIRNVYILCFAAAEIIGQTLAVITPGATGIVLGGAAYTLLGAAIPLAATACIVYEELGPYAPE